MFAYARNGIVVEDSRLCRFLLLNLSSQDKHELAPKMKPFIPLNFYNK